jgi:hypothetical protein
METRLLQRLHWQSGRGSNHSAKSRPIFISIMVIILKQFPFIFAYFRDASDNKEQTLAQNSGIMLIISP